MTIINTILGSPMGYLMYFCYCIVANYGLAIILFTLLSKVILFPLSVLVQKNSIRMAKIKPQLDEISKRHAGDKDRIAEEQIKLYDGEKYSPALGCLPTLIQIPLILGLINVIYNPLQHLLHIGSENTDLLALRTAEILGVESLGFGPQLRIIEAVQNPALLPQFAELAGQIPHYDTVIAQIQGMELSFMGLNLAYTPSIWQPGVLWLIPILSGLSCLVMCIIQNRINVLQVMQGFWSKWGMTIFLVAFSTYFPFIVPVGVGLYWIFGNVFAILVMFIVNWMYDPKKVVDYSQFEKPKQSREQLAAEKRQKQENHLREKSDNKRFYAEENKDKQLVFYSVKNGFYKYMENVIDYVLEHSDIVIHYVTSDPEDKIFQKDHPQIQPYYIGEKALIPFMMKMDADMVVMTMPDLQKFHIKRSLVRKDTEYIYMFHTVASMHMTLREGAVDHYDTVFCVGPHQVAEIRKTEEVYDLPEKKLIECGYGVIDNLTAAYQKMPPRVDGKGQILIAPSWQADNILESCIDGLLEQLLDRGNRVIVRPHPEFGKRFPDKLQALLDRYADRLDADFIIETDFSSNETVYQSDVLITDWSNIAFEFAYSTKKPCLFVNTPMKVMNPEYEQIEITPLDITLRDLVGVSVEPDGLETVGEIVVDMLEHADRYYDQIAGVVEQYLYNPGKSGEIGGRYIMEALEQKRIEKESEEE